MFKSDSKNSQTAGILIKILVLAGLVGFLAGGVAGGVVGGVAGAHQSWTESAWTNLEDWLAGRKKSLSVVDDPTDNQSNKIISLVEEESALIAAVDQVVPAVVSIIVTKELPASRNFGNPFFFPFDDFFNFPFYFDNDYYNQSPPSQQQVGGGTGFVFDQAAGLILTNRHVVEDDTADYTVITNNGTEYQAEVLARDPFNDLAVLKVVGLDNVAEVVLGDSDSLRLGQRVIAIGNSLGKFTNTVTAGVISGIGRDIIAGGPSSAERLEGVIQTDAAINPGNSGGPLVNLAGEVIGINTAISSQGQLIGFAIPVNLAKKVVASVKEYGQIVRPYLGVRYVLVDKILAQENNLAYDYGALVVRGESREQLAVIPGGPADQAGIVENDIILEVNGVRVDEKNSLAKLIQQYLPGDKINIKLYHKGEEKELVVTLEEYKS